MKTVKKTVKATSAKNKTPAGVVKSRLATSPKTSPVTPAAVAVVEVKPVQIATPTTKATAKNTSVQKSKTGPKTAVKPVEAPKMAIKALPKVEATKKVVAVVAPVTKTIVKSVPTPKAAAKVADAPKNVTASKPVVKAPAKVKVPPKIATTVVPVTQPIAATAVAPKPVAKTVAVPKPVTNAQLKVGTSKKPATSVVPVAQASVLPIPAKKSGTKTKPKVAIPAILLEGDHAPIPVGPHGPGQRYALGPMTPPDHLPGGETGELPEAYGTQRLFVAARDPQWIYANWDLTREQQNKYNQLSRDSHLVVRVFSDTFGSAPILEQHVHPESRNWFLPVGKGGMRYLAELGYFDAEGNWVSISKSAATMTPPDSLSEDTSVRFATLPVEIPFYQLLEFVKEAAMEHMPLAEAIREVAQEKFEAIHFPFYPETVSTGASRSVAPNMIPGAAPVPTWTPEQEKALEQLVTIDTVRRVWIGSLEITELIRRHLLRGISSAGAAELSLPSGVALGALGSVTSPFGGEAKRKGKGFWFNVNAELIIYGATEPDAEVIIAGRGILLRKDGTFSYRFALPDGQYDLPVTATAADKSDVRAAALKFSRHTDYVGDVGRHPQDAALKPPLPENVA